MAELFDSYQTWLSRRSGRAAEIMPGFFDPGPEPVRLDAAGLAQHGWTADFLPDTVVAGPGRLAAGGYGEDRAIYDSPHFAGGAEPRTVHLGLDIFAPAGTPVFAPLAGRVHSFADNAGVRDYGPTVILEHAFPELVFYTLYGHLDRDSLNGLFPGRAFAAGEPLGRLGDANVNGGWPAHLHVQVMLDLGGRKGDFPGVCTRSSWPAWCRLCPDPMTMLGG